jgi:hypothetical protein
LDNARGRSRCNQTAHLAASSLAAAVVTKMSVRFTLVDRQLKLLKHGLQSLQKIGNELLLEALPARVSL